MGYFILSLLFIAIVISAKGYLMYLASKTPQNLE